MQAQRPPFYDREKTVNEKRILRGNIAAGKGRPRKGKMKKKMEKPGEEMAGPESCRKKRVLRRLITRQGKKGKGRWREHPYCGPFGMMYVFTKVGQIKRPKFYIKGRETTKRGAKKKNNQKKGTVGKLIRAPSTDFRAGEKVSARKREKNVPRRNYNGIRQKRIRTKRFGRRQKKGFSRA